MDNAKILERLESLEDYIKEYDPDWYGDIDTYSNKVCPCVMCFEENIE
jgi:hypothetical protein